MNYLEFMYRFSVRKKLDVRKDVNLISISYGNIETRIESF